MLHQTLISPITQTESTKVAHIGNWNPIGFGSQCRPLLRPANFRSMPSKTWSFRVFNLACPLEPKTIHRLDGPRCEPSTSTFKSCQ